MGLGAVKMFLVDDTDVECELSIIAGESFMPVILHLSLVCK